jgi:hypothetical protein
MTVLYRTVFFSCFSYDTDWCPLIREPTNSSFSVCLFIYPLLYNWLHISVLFFKFKRIHTEIWGWKIYNMIYKWRNDLDNFSRRNKLSAISISFRGIYFLKCYIYQLYSTFHHLLFDINIDPIYLDLMCDKQWFIKQLALLKCLLLWHLLLTRLC